MGCRWQHWAPVSDWFFLWHVGDVKVWYWLCCAFLSTRVWRRACGPAWSFPLERWGMQALKRALRDFSAYICAFLPQQKNFLLLFPGSCPLYLFLLVSTTHCQVLEAPGAISSSHNAGLAAQSLGKNPAWSTAWGCSFLFPGCGSMWKMCAAHLSYSACKLVD